MLRKAILALVVGIAVWLVAELVGGLIVSAVPLNWADTVGSWLVQWGALLGLLAALYYYFSR
jgi:hypothetical protein